MSIKFVKRSEWLEQSKNSDAVLIGAFVPSLSLITLTMEADCRECGRPVYIDTRENGTAKILCMLCGLKLFSVADQATFEKFLSSKTKRGRIDKRGRRSSL
jgi:hypothetical protein